MTQQQRSPDEARAAAERFRADFEAVREQVGRVIVGQRDTVEGVLLCLFVGGHCLLEGVPGIGKTLLVRTLSRALDLRFGRVQFTPDLMPADITGTTVVHEVEGASGRTVREFRFQQGPLFAQIVLADEINRATPKTQSALLEAMQERSVTVAGVTHELPRPFFVLATQNPVEQEGTYPLPEAQLDRFFFKLLVGSPTREELGQILARTTTGVEAELRSVLDAERLIAHQALVREVAIADHVQDYAIRMVLATHPRVGGEGGSGGSGGSGSGGAASVTKRFGRDPSAGLYATPMTNQYVRMGASPRAAQALVLAAKCRALVEGRPAAGVDDLRAVALPALRHRLILNFEAEAEGVTHDAIVENIVATLAVEG
ncbi:MAG: AAA family ATPase [Phycisphaeraceae bacterium]|nr:AAA family ATPase [Phycisphaeraceae bacterium]